MGVRTDSFQAVLQDLECRPFFLGGGRRGRAGRSRWLGTLIPTFSFEYKAILHHLLVLRILVLWRLSCLTRRILPR